MLKDEDGQRKQIKCIFTFRRRYNSEAKAESGAAVIAEASLSNVDRLAKLLIEPPTGFDDFPMDDRPLEERVRDYFNDPDMQSFVTYAMEGFYLRALPAELFRAG